MKPLEERQIPDFLSGFDGEVLISAGIDRTTGLLMTRSVWQPKGTSFWYSHLDKFAATRRPSIDTGKPRIKARARGSRCQRRLDPDYFAL